MKNLLSQKKAQGETKETVPGEMTPMTPEEKANVVIDYDLEVKRYSSIKIREGEVSASPRWMDNFEKIFDTKSTTSPSPHSQGGDKVTKTAFIKSLIEFAQHIMNKFKTSCYIDILCFIIGPMLITYNFFNFLIVCYKIQMALTGKITSLGNIEYAVKAFKTEPYTFSILRFYYFNPYIPIILITVGVALVCWGFLRHYWKKNTLKEKPGGIHSGLDPTILADLAGVAKDYIKLGVGDMKEFINEAKKHLNETIWPHLEEAWNKAQKELAMSVEKELREGAVSAKPENTPSELSQTHAEQGIKDFTGYSTALIKELGEKVKP